MSAKDDALVVEQSHCTSDDAARTTMRADLDQKVEEIFFHGFFGDFATDSSVILDENTTNSNVAGVQNPKKKQKKDKSRELKVGKLFWVEDDLPELPFKVDFRGCEEIFEKFTEVLQDMMEGIADSLPGYEKYVKDHRTFVVNPAFIHKNDPIQLSSDSRRLPISNCLSISSFTSFAGFLDLYYHINQAWPTELILFIAPATQRQAPVSLPEVVKDCKISRKADQPSNGPQSFKSTVAAQVQNRILSLLSTYRSDPEMQKNIKKLELRYILPNDPESKAVTVNYNDEADAHSMNYQIASRMTSSERVRVFLFYGKGFKTIPVNYDLKQGYLHLNTSTERILRGLNGILADVSMMEQYETASKSMQLPITPAGKALDIISSETSEDVHAELKNVSQGILLLKEAMSQFPSPVHPEQHDSIKTVNTSNDQN